MSNDEYCTPQTIIDFARYVMGSITTDPASTAKAQKIVDAAHYYTKKDEGLSQQWYGNVWLNPPFSNLLIKKFVKRACDYNCNDDDSIMVLVNSCTDTLWYHELLRFMHVMILFRGRISFLLDGVEKKQNRTGQMLFLNTNQCDVITRFYEQQFGYVTVLD